MEAPAVDRVGQTIAGRYRLLRQVGEGGVGTVYEAEQNLGSSPRAVAVKLLRPEWSQDAAVQARFHREAALVARLQHPNTVRIYDFGAAEDGTLFIAMEFLRGRSLQQVLDEQGAQAPERVQRIVSQIAASLQEAHDLGIVHRDLKPDNILILDSYAAERDVVKLVDFGIAKGQPSSGKALTKLTALGTFVGTPAYMSPEQFGGASVGPQSDIYSLGVTSHQMLAGRLPFDAQTAMQWAQAHLGTPAPVLAAEYGAGPIPEAMRRAVGRALAKDPAQRPTSAAQFASEFSGAGGTPAPLAAPAPVAASAAPKLHTAPMTRVPDFDQQARSLKALAATLPDAVLPAPPAVAAGPGRRRVWAALLVAGVGALGFSLFVLYGQHFGFWPRARETQLEPPSAGSGLAAQEAPSEPAPVFIEPDPPVAPAPNRPPAAPVPRSSPPARNDVPAPPAASPAPTPAPTAPPAVPGVPGLPPAPPTLPAPPAPATPPGLPVPPWHLPTRQGACERCLDALRAGGNGSVVSAAGERLLCDDRSGRERCESQIRELAPGVAEQGARAGDCPAALATEAAALHLGVDQQRFSAVNALCVR
jgi:eukaryotic-like serine/threonine-protein kinase